MGFVQVENEDHILPAVYPALCDLNITYPMHLPPKYQIIFYLNIPYCLKTTYKALGLQSCSIPGSET